MAPFNITLTPSGELVLSGGDGNARPRNVILDQQQKFKMLSRKYDSV